jgi:hypothetical protein
VLLLSTQGGDIDKIVRAERFAMIRVFAVAVIVNIILSVLLAEHHCHAAAAAFGRCGARAPWRQGCARKFLTSLTPPGRDRQSFRRAARDDQCALCPH